MQARFAPGNAHRTLVSVGGVVPALVVPVWFTFSRVLTDTAGALTGIFAATALPALVGLYLLALLLPRRWRPYGQSRPGRISRRASVLLIISWCLGVGFGLTVPDVGEGATSVLAALAGDEASGIAAAISNPLGILMLFFAAAAMGFSIADARRDARDPQAEIDDDAVLTSYGYTFSGAQQLDHSGGIRRAGGQITW